MQDNLDTLRIKFKQVQSERDRYFALMMKARVKVFELQYPDAPVEINDEWKSKIIYLEEKNAEVILHRDRLKAQNEDLRKRVALLAQAIEGGVDVK